MGPASADRSGSEVEERTRLVDVDVGLGGMRPRRSSRVSASPRLPLPCSESLVRLGFGFGFGLGRRTRALVRPAPPPRRAPRCRTGEPPFPRSGVGLGRVRSAAVVSTGSTGASSVLLSASASSSPRSKSEPPVPTSVAGGRDGARPAPASSSPTSNSEPPADSGSALSSGSARRHRGRTASRRMTRASRLGCRLSAASSAGVSKSDEPPEAFAAGLGSARSPARSRAVGSAFVSSVRSLSAVAVRPRARSAEAGGAAGGHLALDRGEQHLRDVEDLDLLAGLALVDRGGQPVGEHHPAERAADRDLVGAGGDRLGGAVDVDPLAEVLLHPHPGAAGAAAEGALGVARHLDERRRRAAPGAARAAARRRRCGGRCSRGRGR